MTAATLAIVGALEAAVYLLRYRSAHHPSAAYSAFTTMLTASLRVVFVVFGAKAAIDGQSVAPALAYILSATLTTWAVHAHLERRKASNPKDADE